MSDAGSDEVESSQGPHLASQALHVLPFYSLLSADKQAKVSRLSTHIFTIHLIV